MDKERMKSLTEKEISEVENNLDHVMAALDVTTTLAVMGCFDNTRNNDTPEMQRDSVPTLLYDAREQLKEALKILEPRIEIKVLKEAGKAGKAGK